VEGLDQVDEIIVLRQGIVVRRGSYAECRRADPSFPARPLG